MGERLPGNDYVGPSLHWPSTSSSTKLLPTIALNSVRSTGAGRSVSPFRICDNLSGQEAGPKTLTRQNGRGNSEGMWHPSGVPH